MEYQRYVEKGIALVTIEYEGHGRSDGLNGLISSWDLLIDDTSSFFQQVMKNELPGLKYFLVGEVSLLHINMIFLISITLCIISIFSVNGRRNRLSHIQKRSIKLEWHNLPCSNGRQITS